MLIETSYVASYNYYLLSSSTIVTATWLGSPTCEKDETIERVKFSLPSTITSLIIEILKETSVTPAEKITVYGPEI